MCQVSFLHGHSYASSVLVKKRENSNLQSGENRHYIQFSNFFKFRPLNESLELETIFPQISSPKGMFGRNKKKFDFLRLSFDSRNSQKIARNNDIDNMEDFLVDDNIWTIFPEYFTPLKSYVGG